MGIVELFVHSFKLARVQHNLLMVNKVHHFKINL